MKKINYSNLKIGIISHTFTTGPNSELEKFLKQKVDSLFCISHPFSFAHDIRSCYKLYKKGELQKEHYAYPFKFPDIILFFKDVFFTLNWIIFVAPRLDLIIAIDNLNAFSAWLLKRIGKTKKVIFYTIDYVPNRFNNKVLNRFYHWVDSFCVKNSDKVWNLSSIMISERQKKGISSKYTEKQITVPIGTDLSVKVIPLSEVERYSIAFMGHIREGHGLQLAIDVMPDIVKRIPEAKLVIIGTGPLESLLKDRVEKLGLTKNIEFVGFIKSHEEMQDRLAKCAIAIAPYEDDEKTFTRYTDPGKPKSYMASGLPVIITKVPQVAFEIDKAQAGAAIDYNADQLVEAVISFLADYEKLELYRNNARKFAEQFDWEMIIDQALSKSYL